MQVYVSTQWLCMRARLIYAMNGDMQAQLGTDKVI